MSNVLIGGFYTHRTRLTLMRLASADIEKDEFVLVSPEQYGSERTQLGFVSMWIGTGMDFNAQWKLFQRDAK